MNDLSALVSDFFEMVLGFLGGFFSSAVYVVFNLFQELFDSIFSPLLGVFDSEFESYGVEFFSFFFSQIDNFDLSINIIYWAVGVILFAYIIKHIIFPLIVAIVDDIIDACTPS